MMLSHNSPLANFFGQTTLRLNRGYVAKMSRLVKRAQLTRRTTLRSAVTIRSAMSLLYAMARLSISRMNLDGARQRAGLKISA